MGLAPGDSDVLEDAIFVREKRGGAVGYVVDLWRIRGASRGCVDVPGSELWIWVMSKMSCKCVCYRKRVVDDLAALQQGTAYI